MNDAAVEDTGDGMDTEASQNLCEPGARDTIVAPPRAGASHPSQPHAESSPAALNVFALPAETEIRFRLLLASALVLFFNFAALFAEFATYPLKLPPARRLDREIGQIYQALKQGRLHILPELVSLARADVLASGVTVALIGGFVALAVALAWRSYSTHPARVRRQLGLRPLGVTDDARLLAAVHRVHASLPRDPRGLGPSLPDPPCIEIGAGSMGQMAPAARAFGFREQPLIALSAGTRREVRSAPAFFAVRILHELAHLANRDVDGYEMSKAAWRTLIVVGALPLLGLALCFYLLGDGPGWPLTAFHIRVLVAQAATSLVLAVLVWRNVLREREIYADWRAAQWDPGARDLLVARWRERVEPRGWWALLSFHPRVRERCAALLEPSRLFEPRVSTGLAAGILAAFLMGLQFSVGHLPGSVLFPLMLWGLAELGLQHLSPAVTQVLMPVVAVGAVGVAALSVLLACAALVPLAALIAWALGTQAQRFALVDAPGIERGRRGLFAYLGVAVLFALGYEIGLLVMPGSGAFFVPRSLLSAALVIVHWHACVFVIGAWLGFAHGAGLALLGSHAGTNPPRVRRMALNFVGTLLLLSAFVPLTVLRRAAVSVDHPPTPVAGVTPEVTHAVLTTWGLFLVLAVAVAVGAYLLAGIGLGLYWWRCPRPRCRSCGVAQVARLAVGRRCRACDAALDGWLRLVPTEVSS